MPESIAFRVTAVIAKAQHIPADSVTAEKSFADLGIDSLDGLSIIFSLEEEFGLDIPEEEAKGYTTVAAGSAVGAKPTGEKTYRQLFVENRPRFDPLPIPRIMPNAAAGWIPMPHSIPGPPYPPSTACAAPAHAIGQAFWMVRAGQA